MEIEKIIENPCKDYPRYAQERTDSATAYFDALAKDSKVDVGQNQATCEKYYSAKNESEEGTKSANRRNGYCIARIFVGLIGCVAGFFRFRGSKSIGIKVLGVLIFLAALIGAIAVNIVQSKRAKQDKLTASKAQEKADYYASQASEQRQPLWSMIFPDRADKRIRKILPIIHIDPSFDINRYAYRVKKFGLPRSEGDVDASVLFAKSGRINGNPFLVLREKYHHDERKTYVGTRTVMVRHSYTDSKGNTHYTTTPEVLTATYSELAPFYDFSHVLIFASEAAPDLKFSRNPVLSSGNENIKKVIKNNSKILEKESLRQRNDDNPNTNLQVMSNDEFESLFFAKNRNNEIQFRLLFTPLAQVNRVDLIKNSPYGDDFCFVKDKRLNYIITGHSLNYSFDFNCSAQYIFDFKVLRNQFITGRQDYFKSFYFQLAPLLTIPLYQQLKPFEYIYGREYGFCVSPYDHESRANRRPDSRLRPKGSSTDRILKSSYEKSIGLFDLITVESFAYHATPQTALVPIVASDGNVYNVPVPYYTYSPVRKKTRLAVRKTGYENGELRNRLSEEEINRLIGSIDTPGSLIYNKNEVAFALSGNQGLDNALERISDYLQKKGDKTK